ncbi:MAG: ribosomal protein S18-alanine N-acetyltransferase [Terriglobales bacterium]
MPDSVAFQSAFHIRPSTSADMDALVAVARACFGASAWGAPHFAPHPARVIHIADRPERPCTAYSVLELAADQAELQAIAVLPEWRRQHAGSALIEAANRAAIERGARTMFLEVRESNALAQNFYRRFGFTVCGRRPGYYRLPEEAALVMSLALG